MFSVVVICVRFSDLVRMSKIRILKFLSMPGWFLCLGLLILLNYGAIWSRGGYADDFAFLAYSHSQPYWEAVTNWMTTYNSRVGQGLMMPFLLNIAKGEQTVGFHWWILHGIGLVCFIIAVYFFYKILTLLELPLLIRFVALSIFALHPLNVDVLFWPATIVGYVIPFSLFLVATYFYLFLEKTQNAGFLLRILVFMFLLLSILSIEQLLPLMVLVFVIRFLVFSYAKRQLVESLLFTVISFSLFLYLALAGNTAQRVDKFSTISLLSLPDRVVEVVGASVSSYFLYPMKIVLDQFYWVSLLDVVVSPLFWISIFVVIFLIRRMGRGMIEEKIANDKSTVLFAYVSSVLLWLGALSPLMVVSYYLPGRIFYIPLLGFSLLCGVFFYFVWGKISSPLLRGVFLSCLSLGMVLFSMLNMHHQSEFSKYWHMEKKIINTLSENASVIPRAATVSLHNILLEFGPVPSMIDHYTFPSLLHWMFPDKNISGTTTKSLLSSLSFEIEDKKDVYRKELANDNVPLFITQDKVVRLASFEYLPVEGFSESMASSGSLASDQWDKNVLIERLDLNVSQKYNDGSTLEISSLMRIKELDSLLVNVHVFSSEKRRKSPRLQFHVFYRDGTKVPFDMGVDQDSGFIEKEGWLKRDMLVPNLSEVMRVELSLGLRSVSEIWREKVIDVEGKKVRFLVR